MASRGSRWTRRAVVGLACLAMACGRTDDGGPTEQGTPGGEPASRTFSKPDSQPQGEVIARLPGDPAFGTPPDPPIDPPVDPPGTFPKRCPDFFSDDVVQDLHVEISESDWSAIKYEHKNADALRAAGKQVEIYRPLIRFEHDGRVIVNAMIRLRGNPNAWYKQDKMQFQISFNETNPDGRFRGLRKIVLDSAHYNYSYLRDRLAMSVFREVGVPAPCVNHARLFVNGTFYGLYANIEKVDREFLERNFPDPGGNLWKKGTILKTNEDENPDTSANRAFWRIRDIAAFEAVSDAENAVMAWAAEAVFPDADGYWAGGWNFYWYEDPARGFVYLPWDVDLAFNNLPYTTDPLTWHKVGENFHGRPHVDAVFADPTWRMRFVDSVAFVLENSTVATQQARIDKWAGQIKELAKDDLHAPFTYEQHLRSVTDLRKYVADRAEALEGWVDCVRSKNGSSSGCM